MTDALDHHASRKEQVPALAQNEKNHEASAEDVSDQTSPRSALMSLPWWIILCSSMLLAEMQVALDTTITADLQPTIINTLGEITKFPWINVTYSLANGGSCLVW